MKKIITLLLALFFISDFVNAQELQTTVNYGVFYKNWNVTLSQFNQKNTGAFYVGISKNNFIFDLYKKTPIYSTSFYFGYQKRWGYGKSKLEPVIGIHYNYRRVISREDDITWKIKKWLPLNFGLRTGIDLNLTKKIALNFTSVISGFKYLEFYSFFGIRYTLKNNLKR